jgi:adenylate kinase family enzyme
MARIHILGASGSGTSTLGAAIADALGIRHLDTDQFYWLPTEPPFTAKRPPEARVELLQREMAISPGGWVLSGSAIGWARPIEPFYQLIVYLRLAPEVRMARLRERERQRYGERIGRGGDLAGAHAEFLAWAERYDSAGLEQRSRAAHEAWLARQSAPILRLDSAATVEELADQVLAAVTALNAPSVRAGQ